LSARDAHGQDQCRFVFVLTCFLQSKEVFDYSSEDPCKVQRDSPQASVLQSGSDVNSSLQVESGNVFDSFAFDPDLHDRDHVRLFDSLISFRFELSSSRRILPDLVDDHVKHVFDHVRLSLKLPCSDEITSDCARNFLA